MPLSAFLPVICSCSCSNHAALQDYPYGKFDLDTSGELPAKLLAAIIVVGLPASFAYGIWTAGEMYPFHF